MWFLTLRVTIKRPIHKKEKVTFFKGNLNMPFSPNDMIKWQLNTSKKRAKYLVKVLERMFFRKENVCLGKGFEE